MEITDRKLIYHKIVDITKECPGAQITVWLAFLQYQDQGVEEWPFVQLTDSYKSDFEGIKLRDFRFYFRAVVEDEVIRGYTFRQWARRFSLTPEALAKIISDHTPNSYRKACGEIAEA